MTDTNFEPSRYLTKLSGKDYLEVKWRLVWLRTDHPDATIATTPHLITSEVAIVLATVSIPRGGSASGIGSETPGDFRDYIEKAETKAIGRALAALGYGTQFTDDHEFGADQGRVVDAPVQRPQNGQQRQLPSTGDEATPRQREFITKLAKEVGVDARALGEMTQRIKGDAPVFTRRMASTLIDELNAKKGGSEGTNPKTPEERLAGKRTQLHIRLKELLPDEAERERLLRSTLHWGYGTQTTKDLTWEQLDEVLTTFTTDLQGVRDVVDTREIADGPPPQSVDDILRLPWEEELPF